VIDTVEVDNVVLGAPSVVATLRNGHLVYRSAGVEVREW
jgi:hypothetical protein